MSSNKNTLSADRRYPIPCVGGVVIRGDEVLLIKRGKAPRKGSWSIPGGKVERGETQAEALIREIREETGIDVHVGALLTTIDMLGEDVHYVLIDFACLPRDPSQTPVAGDDADAAEFVKIEEAIGRVDWQETADLIQHAYKLTLE